MFFRVRFGDTRVYRYNQIAVDLIHTCEILRFYYCYSIILLWNTCKQHDMHLLSEINDIQTASLVQKGTKDRAILDGVVPKTSCVWEYNYYTKHSEWPLILGVQAKYDEHTIKTFNYTQLENPRTGLNQLNAANYKNQQSIPLRAAVNVTFTASLAVVFSQKRLIDIVQALSFGVANRKHTIMSSTQVHS